MKRIFIATHSARDWQPLLAKPELHWKPGASAMTAAACWEDSQGRLPAEISTLLASANDPNLANLQLLLALPEWEVELPGGTTTSHTDVLAICRSDVGLCIIGVEAKVLEDFGPLVGAKRSDASAGQLERLAFLHNELGVEKFADDIRYQLLHRTASALLTAKQFHATTAVMLVHAFDCPDDRKHDFTTFARAMMGEPVAPDVYVVRRFDKPRLYLAWCTGNCVYRQVDLRKSTNGG